MKITPASPADVDDAVSCLAKAFGQDPITGYLLQMGRGYPERAGFVETGCGTLGSSALWCMYLPHSRR